MKSQFTGKLLPQVFEMPTWSKEELQWVWLWCLIDMSVHYTTWWDTEIYPDKGGQKINKFILPIKSSIIINGWKIIVLFIETSGHRRYISLGTLVLKTTESVHKLLFFNLELRICQFGKQSQNKRFWACIIRGRNAADCSGGTYLLFGYS